MIFVLKRWDALSLISFGSVFGIAGGTFFPLIAYDAMSISVLLIFACGFSCIGKPFFVRIILFGLAFLFGIWIGSSAWRHWEELPSPDGSIRGEGVVVIPGGEKAFTQESVIRLASCESAVCPKEKILFRERNTERRMIGDRIEFSCDIERPDELIEMAGRQVPYRWILASRGIGFLCEKPSEVIERGEENTIPIFFLRSLSAIREQWVRVMTESLPSTEGTLALGMLLGADEGFSPAERSLFVRTGVTHVTAVSGYNITLVGGLLFFLAIILGWYRRGASLFAIFGIAAFVILVGAPASAVRAGIMGALLFVSLALGRPGSGFRLWLLSLAGMLVANPLLLRFDIGFELSYLATFALLLYAGVRTRLWMPQNFFVRILYEGMILSLFVEWLVVPVILLQFGTFSAVSILANTFLTPLVPLIMLFTFLSGIFALFLPGGILILNWLAFFFAHIFVLGAEMLDALPMSFFSHLSVPIWWIVLWYVVTGYLFLLFSNSADHTGRS